MRSPLQRLPWFVAAASILGVVAWVFLGCRSVTPRTSASSSRVASVVPADRIVHFETNEESSAAPVLVAEANAPRVVAELPASESLQFATLCDLQLMASEAELDLTAKQWSAFAAAVVQMQAVRHHYEAQIATVHELAPNRYRLDIPAYASAGDELRRQFVSELESALGREAATEVMDKLGRKLESRFAGFGVGTQTLEITGDPTRAPNDVQVARTAKFWNSIDGADWVTTRKEVHFPGAEDPTGENWNAFLALLPSAD